MPLVGPSSEDQRKIHSEINQIVHQRFLIATLAITMFGVVAAWVIPKQAPSPGMPVGGLAFAGSVTLSLVLLVLYLFSHRLRATLRVFTTYLAVTKSSSWEIDWQEFRRKSYAAYTKTYTLVFILLTVLSVALPFVIAEIYALTLQPGAGVCMEIVVGSLSISIMFLMGYRGWFDNEKHAKKRWEELNNP